MATMWLGPPNGGPLIAAAINSTSPTIALVAGAAGQIIRIFKIFLVVGGTTNLTFEDGSTALTGAIPMASNGSLTLDMDGTAWFTSSAGNALNLLNSGSVQVSGAVYYTQTSG